MYFSVQLLNGTFKQVSSLIGNGVEYDSVFFLSFELLCTQMSHYSLRKYY